MANIHCVKNRKKNVLFPLCLLVLKNQDGRRWGGDLMAIIRGQGLVTT